MNIFQETIDRYGEIQARTAIGIIDQYVDTAYTSATGRTHPEMTRAKRMTFAAKLLDCMNETGATEDHICFALNNALHSEVDDPTIYYATSPRVLGYWIMTNEECGFECVRETNYQPVGEYF